MIAYDNPLTALAARVRGGDAAALVRLRKELEPRLAEVVQQVQRIGPGRSALDRLIARELAHSSRALARGPRDEQALAAQVARRVSAAIFDDLRRPAAGPEMLWDTVRDL